MTIYVLDTETSGLNKPENGSGVCDVAIMQLDSNGHELARTESLIHPECEISPTAMGIHHITNEMVAESPTLAGYMESLGNPLMDAQVLIGHNVRYDLRFLVGHYPESAAVLDTLKLARMAWPDLENHQLQTIRYTYKLEAGDAHRAMGDVVTTQSLIMLLCEHFNTDILGLVEICKKPMSLDTKMPFGKHKGMSLKDLPMSYVKWLLGTPDIDVDLKQALQARA